MNELYYKISPHGYEKTYAIPPQGIDLTRRIPVYRVVNQFMNLDPEEPKKSEAKEDRKQQFFVDVQLSNPLKTEPTQDKVRLVSLSPVKQMEREEVKSVYTSQQQMPSKEKQLSMRNLKSSQVGTVMKARFNKNESEANTESVTAADFSGDKKLLTFELEKERILRKNLEKSYEVLLKTLQEREMKFSFCDGELEKSHKRKKSKGPHTDRYSKKQHYLEEGNDEQNEPFEGVRARRSYCDYQQCRSQKLYRINDQFCNEDELNDYFQAEKLFQYKLKEQMTMLQRKIEQIDSNLAREELRCKQRQEKILHLEREKVELKCSLQQEKVQRQKKQQNAGKNGLQIKEHVHYIFTIFIMFLCFAMFVKSKH